MDCMSTDNKTLHSVKKYEHLEEHQLTNVFMCTSCVRIYPTHSTVMPTRSVTPEVIITGWLWCGEATAG